MRHQDQAIAPFSADIDQVIYDMNRTFNPLHKDLMLQYQVQASRDGYVLLTIALPEGMIRVFTSMLESMSGFFRFMQIKAKSSKASAAARDPSELQRRDQVKSDYKNEVFGLFDGFIGHGHTTKEAISLTNLALKQRNHPWATYDLVPSVLRPSGRLRKDFANVHKSTGR